MLKQILAIVGIVILTVAAHYVRLARLTLNAFEPYISDKSHIIHHNDTGISLYDRDNQLFFSFYQAKNKQIIPLNDISPIMRQAAVAIEDHDFLTHHGFSPR